MAKVRRNQFGDVVEGEDEPMSIAKWEEKWRLGKTKFHMSVVHPMLQKHIDMLTCGRRGQRIFLPLCGKSLDLNWLASQGHDVIGNEAVEMGCRQFFDENNIEYTESEINTIPGKCFKAKSEDCRITLYCCDFYQLTKDIIGHIDCIWDRGSLAAIDRTDRPQYSKTIADLLSPDTRYLIDVFRVDNEVFAGPPHDISVDELHSLFENCNVEKVQDRDAMTDWQRSWGVKYFTEIVFSLNLKRC